MSLNDLKVYSEYAYSTRTEILQQQFEKFNSDSAGAIVLRAAAHQGDFSEEAFFQKIVGGTVRRRNPYGSGAIAESNLVHIANRSVKVASGTPPMRIDPGQFKWIQRNPQEAGVALGQQLAADTMADMLNTGLGAAYAALSGVTGVVHDVRGVAGAPNWKDFVAGAGLFGDQSSRIVAWVMHSAVATSLYENNLTNFENLFSFGTVNVMRDPFGRLLVITDSPSLVAAGTYHVLGLVQEAIYLGQNNDFDAVEENKTGDENLIRVYQAEWSFNLGIQGFAWDTATGGKAPTDASILTGTSWERYSTDIKNLAGVVIETN